MNTESIEIWRPIYHEIHQHLRDNDKKRDQTIAFYLIILAAYIGIIGKPKPNPVFYNESILIGVWIIGLICLLIVTQYRRWHIVHHCTFVTLQKIMSLPLSLSEDICEKAWNDVNDTPSVFDLMNPLRGVETCLIYFLSLLTFIPVFFLVDTFYGLFTLLLAIVYILLSVYLSSRYVLSFHKFNRNEWPFRWLREQESMS
mgnify:CR=1 FL=1